MLFLPDPLHSIQKSPPCTNGLFRVRFRISNDSCRRSSGLHVKCRKGVMEWFANGCWYLEPRLVFFLVKPKCGKSNVNTPAPPLLPSLRYFSSKYLGIPIALAQPNMTSIPLFRKYFWRCNLPLPTSFLIPNGMRLLE
jgi:hypothetical protein